MLRRLAEKKFVLCSVVLRKSKHVVDLCNVLMLSIDETSNTLEKCCRLLEQLDALSPLPTIGLCSFCIC